ncbi:MAG TPA: hypothetical protein VF457_04425 [Burkholderiaceae bacterium]
MPAATLSFDTPAEAEHDAALHRQAPRDAHGRPAMTREYLRRLVSELARGCGACARVYFGGVYWQPPDASGANWNVAVMSGDGDRAACLAGVQAGLDALRRRYALLDET